MLRVSWCFFCFIRLGFRLVFLILLAFNLEKYKFTAKSRVASIGIRVYFKNFILFKLNNSVKYKILFYNKNASLEKKQKSNIN